MIMDLVFILLLLLNIIFFLITIYNLFTAPKLERLRIENQNKFISVLVPARNEGKNIANILNDIINQTYKNYEVIVLNDNSTDETEKIINTFIEKDNRIKLISGKKLPENWLGKNYACYQLSQNANGELLLFIDADVRLSEGAIESAIKMYTEKNVKMLSVFPSQFIQNISTYIVTPMMNWLLLTFLPLKKVYSSNNKSFVAANGQFILIEKETYFKIGGHKAIKNKVVEDMELARIAKKNKIKIITLLGNNIVKCKMYSTFKEAFEGFSKNFYSGFNTNPITFSLLLIFIQLVFVLPAILVFFNVKFILIVVLIIFSRMIISKISNQNELLNIILHPLQIIVVFLVGINSMLLKYFRKIEWKGRRL